MPIVFPAHKLVGSTFTANDKVSVRGDSTQQKYKMKTFSFIVFISLVVGALAVVYTQPEQVHLSLSEMPRCMTVTWVTLSKTQNSTVEYGVSGFTTSVAGTMTTFVDGGSEHRHIYMHRASICGLKPGQRYVYHVGDGSEAWSNMFYFVMPRPDPNWSPRFAVYGDLGNINPRSLPRLQQEAQMGQIDAVLHVGDFAYELHTDNARLGDQFMRQIEAVGAYVPYMITVGNHESYYNFSNYRARFNMPNAGGDGEGLFYSYDLGPAHIISFSTEVYYFTQYGTQQIVKMQRWLEADLIKANANRAQRPWIITLGHRPYYCSNSDRDDCTYYDGLTRYMTEDLFYKYGVDVMIFAHEHSYERLWPLYNHIICNGTRSPYDNPPAPINIITGSAGMYGAHDPFKPDQPAWSAFRSVDYGYSRMTIHNATHLSFEQVSDDQGGKVIDKIVVIRDKHAAGMYTCHKSTKNQWTRKQHEALRWRQHVRKMKWLKKHGSYEKLMAKRPQ